MNSSSGPTRLDRRRLLQLAAGSVAGLGLGMSFSARLYAAPADGPRFLLVFLRGGYDAANLLVPYTSDFYYEARPTLAIARPAAGDTGAATDAGAADAGAAGVGAPGAGAAGAGAGALALDADWALAPALRDSVGPLYRARQAAFIPFVGTDDLSRSHFETQDTIELGQPLDGSRDYHSGFLARLSMALTGAGIQPSPIAFTNDLPLSFRGAASAVPNLALGRVRPRSFDDHEEQLLESMYAGRSLESSVTSGLHLSQDVVQRLNQEMQAASRGAVASQGFAQQAERMAALMRDSYRIGFVDVGGWDTHVGEGGADGVLATRLAALGQGLAAFARASGMQWRQTVVVVLSEFGRTFRENGDRGTDHGHGSVYWVLGGAIHGGRIVGAQQRVARETLFQDRDYPVLNNYRSVLGGLFRSLWQLTPSRCEQVFPGAAPLDLGLV